MKPIDFNKYKEGKDELEQAYDDFVKVWNKHFKTAQNLTGAEAFKRMYVAFRILDSEVMFSKIFCGEYFERERLKKLMEDFVKDL